MPFYGEEGNCLGHVISHDGTEVDRAKIDLIANISPPTCVKLWHVRFYRQFIQDFNKIAKPLISLLAKDVPCHFFEECLKEFVRFESTKHKRGVNCAFSSIALFSQTVSKPVRTGCS